MAETISFTLYNFHVTQTFTAQNYNPAPRTKCHVLVNLMDRIGKFVSHRNIRVT